MTLCNYEGCIKQAFYGEKYETPLRCKEHKENYKLQYKICACGLRTPSFNFEGEKRAKCCNDCKEDGMISFTGHRCKCGKSACFNYKGKKKGVFCVNCKDDDMIDIVNACECGEGKKIYNFKGKQPKYCKKCKKENMINTRSTRCHCKKAIPIYNFKDKKPKYCKNCKKEGMIDVKHDRCDCGTFASYNFPGETKGICCVECKEDSMIDVKNKQCKCGKSFLLYNYPGEKRGICCADCKTDSMIDVVHRKCKCGNIPTFNYEEEPYAVCCLKCKKDNMVNVADRGKRCKGPLCIVAGNKKYRGYCTHCFAHLFPTDPLTFQIKKHTKELIVRDFINQNYEDFYHDKALWTSDCDCTHRRRIDHRKIINGVLLGIDTDEDQHKNYDKEDEINRYHDITIAHTRKIIFIRFNPDKYIDNKGNTQDPDIYDRLPYLKKEIDKQIKNIENEDYDDNLLEIHKLFYNGFKDINI